jgi:2-methylcitrate dehydratase PrpD
MASDEIAVTERLVGICRGIVFEDLSPEVVIVAKQCLLDWFGVTIAGAVEPLTRMLREQALAEGGNALASLVPGGEHVTCSQAALVNGSASHALDYDDVNTMMSGHPTVPVVPGLLALAESRGEGAREFIAALVAGVEMECRAGAYVAPGHYAKGFHATGTLGTFGSAAACCHLLGLAPQQWRNALGIAGSRAAGLKSMFGTMTKPLQAGNAAANGLFAAMMASKGFTANPDVFETAQGFAATQTDTPNAGAAIEGRGHLAIEDTLFKYHAACYGTHATIEGVLRLKHENSVAPDDVEAIRLTVPPGNLAMCNIQEPVTGLEGKFSLRFTAAAALFDGATDEAAFNDARVADPRLVNLRDRVSVAGSGEDRRGTTVALRLKDGRELSKRVDLNIPERDLDLQWERLTAKFLGLAAPVIGMDAAQQLMETVRGLERVDSMADVVALAVTRKAEAPA